MPPQPIVTPRRFNIEQYQRLAEVGALRWREGVELMGGLIYLMNPVGVEAGSHIRVAAGGRAASDGKPAQPRPDVRYLPDIGPEDTEVYLRRFTVPEYQAMCASDVISKDERIELLDGHVVTMSPSGSRHSFVVTRLARILIKAAPESLDVRVQEPLIGDAYSQPEPDIAIVPASPIRFWASHPHAAAAQLIVEVSDSTLERDQLIKGPMYRSVGVAEYWIVDVESQCITVFLDGKEQRVTDRVAPACCPEMLVEVQDLFGEADVQH
ncbi:MAG: Uma2 family endonuclease [Rhodothermales bacterium]|nr:Uma2 family endonuclease [Rhodothermales bacterium]